MQCREKNSSGSLTASKRREQWKHRYGSASPDGNRRFRGHRPGLAGCICTRGHPKKIYEPSVHPDQNTHLRGFCYLNYIQGKEGETASHRVSPRGGEGSGGGVPLPDKGVLGQPQNILLWRRPSSSTGAGLATNYLPVNRRLATFILLSARFMHRVPGAVLAAGDTTVIQG